jgi:hypothetical protein
MSFAEGPQMTSRRQGVATVNRLMAVTDEAEAATNATRELVQAGFSPAAITVLQGDEDADRIDAMGTVGGRWKRAWRLLQFTQTDQMVDLAIYEAALRHGRLVIAVHARGDRRQAEAKRILTTAGAHFMNFFGRLATEDISRWRGKELPVSATLLR